MNKITVYEFPNYAPEIYADLKGKFFCNMTDKFIDTKYYNGRICVQYGTKRYGIKKLRANVIKSTKEIPDLPF